MEEIIKKLENRKEQLRKECSTNKIRVNELNVVIGIIEKELKNQSRNVQTEDVIEESLKKEMSRLLEKNNSTSNPEELNKNILTMCEIAKTLNEINH